MHRGDTLVRIHASDVMARKAQAEASLAQAKASLKQIAASEREAQARYNNAESNRKRFKKLFDSESIAEEQYEDTLTKAEVAKAQLEAMIAQKSVIDANEAMAEAQIQEAQALLDYATLQAPISGVITEKRVEIGDMSSPGVPILTLEDQSRVKVELVVPEENIPYIHQGMPVEIQVDAMPGKSYQGKVDIIIPSGDPLSHAFQVKVILANPEGELKAGMFVRAKIIKEHREQALKIPLDAVLEKGEQRFVFRVKNEKAERVEIQPGLQDLTSLEVLQPLAAGGSGGDSGKRKPDATKPGKNC